MNDAENILPFTNRVEDANGHTPAANAPARGAGGDDALQFATMPASDPGAEPQYLRKDQPILLQGDKQCWLIPVKQISMLESEGNYTRVYFGKERTLILRSLNSLEGRLDPAMFFRASRKHIINVSAIEKIIPAATRTLLVTLRDGFMVEMSRRQTQIFRALMTL